MNTKTKQVLAVMSLKVIFARKFINWDKPTDLVVFTDDKEEARYESVGYFHPDSDNGDVLYDVIEQVTGFRDNERIVNDIFFFAELMLEDMSYKMSPFVGAKRKTDEINFEVSNLTDDYLDFLEEQRKIVYALLIGGYYDEFTGA